MASFDDPLVMPTSPQDGLLAAATRVAIIATDLQGLITSWNREAERLYGYTADEALGKPASILIPQERKDELPGLTERVNRGERIESYETSRRSKDGSEVRVSLTLSPIKNAAGGIVGASTIARRIFRREARGEAEEKRS